MFDVGRVDMNGYVLGVGLFSLVLDVVVLYGYSVDSGASMHA